MRMALDLLVYLVLLLVELLLRSLPPRATTALAEWGGRLWYRLDGRRRQRALDSLGVAARGGLDVPDPEALVRRTFRALMHIPIEVLVLGRYFRTGKSAVRRCRFVGDWKALGEDLQSGRGGVFVSGHLGSWELAAWVLRFLDVPAGVVARSISNPFVERRLVAARGGPERVITKHGAVRRVFRAVGQGAWIGILADQNAGAGGLFVPFFGLPASTWATPAVVALRAGVPLYAVASLRRRDVPFTYEIHARRLPTPDASLPEDEAIRAVMGSQMAALEGWIRLAPDQYNWVHRRWRSGPAGEEAGVGRPVYDRPSPRNS